jgi:hypothetical protein
MVTIYDIQNKFVAYSAPIPEVVNIFCEWGSLYALSADGKVRLNSLIAPLLSRLFLFSVVSFARKRYPDQTRNSFQEEFI